MSLSLIVALALIGLVAWEPKGHGTLRPLVREVGLAS